MLSRASGGAAQSQPWKVRVGVAMSTYLFDMSMCVYKCVCVKCSDCTPRAVEHAVVAVKYRTLFNLMLQSLAGALVSFVS